MHIVITGASRGIGLAIANRFAQADHSALSLSLCARNEQELRAQTADLVEHCPNISVLAEACDVSNEHDAERFIKKALDSFGPVDVLINNAGFGKFEAVEKMPTRDFDDVLATNLRGVFLMTQAVLPGMIRRQTGTIVTISSVAGKRGYPGGGAYCTAKFGVRGLMQSLWQEVRPHGIRVITVLPGNVDTKFFDVADRPLVGDRKTLAMHSEDIAEAVYSAVMLPARATVAEIEIVPTRYA